jgi:Family of unknown function (DUF6282)
VSVDLGGAADLHCHFGPDAHRARSVDAFAAAREARDAGHRALVLKSHDFPTAALAWAVQEHVEGVSVFGGVCCDREIGGVNPAAVETALRLDGKIVWLPTLSSRQDFDNGVAAQLGIRGPGLVVTDDVGDLLPETREVLALVREHDAILATGHVSTAEHYAVVRAFARDAPVLVTHATEELAGPHLDAAQCRELADLGAWIELCAMTCIGALATKTVAEMAATIQAVGLAHVTLGTDFGQAINPHPAPGLQTFADALFAAGCTEAQLRTMACENPCRLLGLD